jgi:DNA-binding transcriptional LysR family regulator
VRPTAAALALRPLVRVLLGDAGNIGAEVRRLRTGESGEVKLGAPQYQLTYFLAAAIARYRREYPAATLPTIVSIATADPYTALAEGKVDLVAGTQPRAHGFQSLPLYPVWLAAAGRKMRRGLVEVTALRGLPLAVLTRDFASRVLLESALARVGIEPNLLFEDVHADSLLALAREGLATAVVVNEAVPPKVGLPVAKLCVRGKPLEFELSLMWRDEPSLSPSARRLRDTIAALAHDRRRRATGSRRTPERRSRS